MSLPEGWLLEKIGTREGEEEDSRNDEMVYLNTVSNQTFFELPHFRPAFDPLVLPDGWTTAVSRSTGVTYFVMEDGSTTYGPVIPQGWEMQETPDGHEMLFVDTVSGDKYFELPHNKQAGVELLLPGGWTKAVSRSTGAIYFVTPAGEVTYDFMRHAHIVRHQHDAHAVHGLAEVEESLPPPSSKKLQTAAGPELSASDAESIGESAPPNVSPSNGSQRQPALL